MSINSNLQSSDYAGKEVWYRGCGLNMTNFDTSVTSGCVPVNNFGIRGMTCWCKTNLCNEDFVLNDELNPNGWDMKRVESKHHDSEF